jgi:hypothetical protein
LVTLPSPQIGFSDPYGTEQSSFCKTRSGSQETVTQSVNFGPLGEGGTTAGVEVGAAGTGDGAGVGVGDVMPVLFLGI